MVPEDPFPHNASSSALSAGGLAGSGGLEQEQHVHILLVEGDGRACAPAQVAPGATHPPSRSPKIHTPQTILSPRSWSASCSRPATTRVSPQAAPSPSPAAPRPSRRGASPSPHPRARSDRRQGRPRGPGRARLVRARRPGADGRHYARDVGPGAARQPAPRPPPQRAGRRCAAAAAAWAGLHGPPRRSRNECHSRHSARPVCVCVCVC